MLFQGEPLEMVYVPENNSQIVGAVVTRSKMKQIAQQQDQIHTTIPSVTNDKSSSSSQEKIEHSDEVTSALITANNFDINQI
ncbi:unnamed protein product, partial [Rotaria sordida]